MHILCKLNGPAPSFSRILLVQDSNRGSGFHNPAGFSTSSEKYFALAKKQKNGMTPAAQQQWVHLLLFVGIILHYLQLGIILVLVVLHKDKGHFPLEIS